MINLATINENLSLAAAHGDSMASVSSAHTFDSLVNQLA